MTFEVYEKKFSDKAFKVGFSQEEVQKCLLYARPILERNLPIIYNTSHLASLVGYKKNYLKRAVLFTPYFYRTYKIKKKASNKLRLLNEPLPSLKEIQIWILNNILYELKVSRFAKAYVPGRNILDNVRYHKKKTKVLTLDIENFFGSLKRPRIEKIFADLGYSSNVANLLGKLCCCNDILPQGAPTSPYLSNICMIDFDNHVYKYCFEQKIRYTRYADDLIFSGDFDELPLIDLVTIKLNELELTLNKEKIKVMTRDQRQLITGIVVNDKIQMPKAQRNFIRQELYYIKKVGLAEHMFKTNNLRANYVSHLLGKISYALYINPNDKEMKEYRDYIKKHLK